MSPVGAALADFLRRLAPAAVRHDLCVALSGGVDSTALLLGALELRDHPRTLDDGAGATEAPPPLIGLRAVHVDHGLLPDARNWADRCAALCAERDVPLSVLSVAVDRRDPQGLEAAARNARYSALQKALRAGEWLLTAHQADDQLETVLIQLLRGAGVAGLAAMPETVRFGAGWHGRPLLTLRRTDLESFVAAAGVCPIADPMNSDSRYDRGYLRRSVLPALLTRWPEAAATIARTARHCATAQSLLDQRAAEDGALAVEGSRLRLAPVAGLEESRRVNLVRWWLRESGLKVPATAQLEQIVRQMWGAADERMPLVSWRGGQVRRYRGVLHALPCPPAQLELPQRAILRPGAALELGTGLGSLTLLEGRGEGLAARLCEAGLQVRARRGGEELRLHIGGPRRPLRLLLQEAGIPPWSRGALPLLWSGKELVAVADRWLSADHRAGSGDPGFVPVWSGRPSLQ